MLAWVTVWRTTVSLFSHPVACRYHGTRRHITGISTLFVITFCLFCVSTNAIYRIGGITENLWFTQAPKYDCLESQIEAAPGTTTCSAQHLCSKEMQHLFTRPDYHVPGSNWGNPGPMQDVFTMIYFFGAMSFIGSIVLTMIFMLFFRRADLTGRKSKGRYFIRFASRCAVVVHVVVLTVISYYWTYRVIAHVIYYNSKDSPGRQSSLMYDQNCTAVHITMSDWKWYLDVDHDRNRRVAKMWLNA
jgi:hypothetical protein